MVAQWQFSLSPLYFGYRYSNISNSQHSFSDHYILVHQYAPLSAHFITPYILHTPLGDVHDGTFRLFTRI